MAKCEDKIGQHITRMTPNLSMVSNYEMGDPDKRFRN